MNGGYYAGLPPDQGDNWTHDHHNGALYSDPGSPPTSGWGCTRCPATCGGAAGGSCRRPRRSRTARLSDPDFSWQGQWPMPGTWATYTDPQSGQPFPVWEGHYVYTGSDLSFIPTFAGGMFEGLMANEVVPETSWGPHSFGRADERTARVQIKYAIEQLGYPVWGMSPSSTPDYSGGYGGFGVEGLVFPYYGFGADTSHPNHGLSQCHGCATEDVVTPHASFLALDVTPQQAYANISNTWLTRRTLAGRRRCIGSPTLTVDAVRRDGLADADPHKIDRPGVGWIDLYDGRRTARPSTHTDRRLAFASRATVCALDGGFILKAAELGNPRDTKGLDATFRSVARSAYDPITLAALAIGLFSQACTACSKPATAT